MPEPTPVLPETLDQIRHLPAGDRPLLICDVDEVVLHLIRPLEDYLAANDLRFLTNEFRLTGNIASKTGEPLSGPEVRQHLDVFFTEVTHRQEMVDGADIALGNLARDWDIVLLTNLPGTANKPAREKLLSGLGIPYPVVTNSGPKGGAVAALAAGREGPVVFIDDSPSNHLSVHSSLPATVQVQFVADERFRREIVKADHVALLTGDWKETEDFIGAILPA